MVKKYGSKTGQSGLQYNQIKVDEFVAKYSCEEREKMLAPKLGKLSQKVIEEKKRLMLAKRKSPEELNLAQR